MGKPVRVVIIDSGIDLKCPLLSKKVVASTGILINEDGQLINTLNPEVKNFHGSIIAGIIHNIGENVEFIDINILNECLSTDGRVLLHAFSRALQYKPDVIHLSLGTLSFRYYFALKRFVRMAQRNHVLIVAAADNNGRRSYPSHLNGVIGVKADPSKKLLQYSYKNGFFYAPASVEGISGIERYTKVFNAYGSSMAAAYITGHIVKDIYNEEMNDIDSCNDAYKMLKKYIKNRGRFYA